MRRKRLIIFTKYPEPGKVKTRLIPVLGKEGAASLHQAMTERTLLWAKSLSRKSPVLIEIWFEGGSRRRMEEWLGPELNYFHQGDGNLGERMERVFRENFQRGRKEVVLVGVDCPELTAFHGKAALDALKNHDLVLGPTNDGGYCLIGLKRMIPEIFQSIAWGTDKVHHETLERARNRGLSVKDLNLLHDVDVPQDLPLWERASNQSISVIIPALNEEDHIRQTLERLGKISHGEVIVVDGGSTDSTVRVAKEFGARVLSARPCRGGQMNAGASEASGDLLLFLHADTIVPDNFLSLIRQTMTDPEVVGGSFALKIQPSTPLLRYIEKDVTWRTKLFRLPYGDQAIFIRASVFRLMGGFADIALMEDVEFVRRLRKIGRLAFIPKPVITSSRRYEKLGAVRAILKNKLVLLGYYLKIPPSRLALFYYRKEKEEEKKDRDSTF
jgi:rSAM/selenodomain-associated transferase 2/rSAM/selenodomain-associated transferase 1